MNSKHVKIGETYNCNLFGTDTKVIVKGRHIEKKSHNLSFETVEVDAPENAPHRVSAKVLSPLPVAS